LPEYDRQDVYSASWQGNHGEQLFVPDATYIARFLTERCSPDHGNNNLPAHPTANTLRITDTSPLPAENQPPATFTSDMREVMLQCSA